MPTAVGTAAQGGAASQTSPLNITHDSGATGARRCLVVGIASYDGGSGTVSSVTYGGNSLTAFGSGIGSPGAAQIRLYRLVNPPTGSNTLAITTSQTMDELFAICQTFSDVNQTTPLSGEQSATGTAGTATIPTITLTGSDIGIGMFYGFVSNNWTITQSDTLIAETEGTVSVSGRAMQYGDANLSWTMNNSPEFNVLGAALVHDDVGSGPAVISSATPSGTIGTTTTATIGATSDQNTGTIYAVVDTAGNISGITADQVKAGENNVGGAAISSANASVSTLSPAVSVSGLSPATGYSYAVVQNTTGGDSNVLTGTFTTATAAILAQTRQYGVQGSLRTIIGL